MIRDRVEPVVCMAGHLPIVYPLVFLSLSASKIHAIMTM